VTAAAVLLAGCSGGDDKKSDSSPGSDGNDSASSPTPTAPELPSFDPPKAFSAVDALAVPRPEGTLELKPGKSGMVGKTTLYANKTGLVGRWIDGGQSWTVPAKEVESTKIVDFAAPMAVQLDGKEVIATAYIQDVEAGGTQKAHGQVNFQWIDPDDGKVLSTAVVDLTPAIGVGNTGGHLLSQAYDTATGQIGISLGVESGATTTAKFSSVTAYADPKTKLGAPIQDLRVAAVLGGTVVGARGEGKEGSKTLSIALADGATGALKKNIPIPTMNYLSPIGTGGKHAYLDSSSYVSDSETSGHYVSSVYVVDIAAGTLAEMKLPNTQEQDSGYTCFSDHVASVVCNHSGGNTGRGDDFDEVVGFDDTTGKKAWGYTSKTGNRVVPTISTVYNGAVYGQAETLPAVLDAKTGQDIPVSSPTPGATPTDGSTPTAGGTPSDDGGPTGGDTPSTGSTGSVGGWGDTSMIYGAPRSPEMVSKYGSTYLLDPGGKAPLGSENILVAQKAIS
jgi:hypothetical protein